MSLITDNMLIRLWQDAQAQSSDEWASVKLWTHLWSKYFFSEKEWVVTQETPPEGTGRRRVDITIEYLGSDGKLAVLTFHEAKALDAGPRDIEEVETQAHNACARYLGQHPELEFVYAVTSFGTKAKAWHFIRGTNCLTALFGSNALAKRGDCIELHSSDAGLLREAIQMMKSVPPSE